MFFKNISGICKNLEIGKKDRSGIDSSQNVSALTSTTHDITISKPPPAANNRLKPPRINLDARQTK